MVITLDEMKWIITASERQTVVAVAVFKHVSTAHSLCGFFIFFLLLFFRFFFFNNFPPEHCIKEADIFPLSPQLLQRCEALRFSLPASGRSL